MLQRIQEHTVKIYNLNNQSYQIETVKARTLLSPYRFDLYAKLYYIKHRKERPEKALEVYNQHIKTFNPDWKEPGREDKISQKDFIDYLHTEGHAIIFREVDIEPSWGYCIYPQLVVQPLEHVYILMVVHTCLHGHLYHLVYDKYRRNNQQGYSAFSEELAHYFFPLFLASILNVA